MSVKTWHSSSEFSFSYLGTPANLGKKRYCPIKFGANITIHSLESQEQRSISHVLLAIRELITFVNQKMTQWNRPNSMSTVWMFQLFCLALKIGGGGSILGFFFCFDWGKSYFLALGMIPKARVISIVGKITKFLSLANQITSGSRSMKWIFWFAVLFEDFRSKLFKTFE